jgi:hypothetical protein
MKRFLILIIGSLLVISFDAKPKWTERKVNELYSIFIYNSMVETKNLNESASLQYQDSSKQLYILIIDEEKKSLHDLDADYTLDAYFKFVVANMKGINEFASAEPVSLEINGLKAKQAIITGKTKNQELYYNLVVLESRTHLFQIVAWTTADSKEKKKLSLDAMIRTFRILN